MRFRFYLLILFVSNLPAVLEAQPVFSTVTDALSIHLNGILQVQYIVENARKIEDFRTPDFRDFKVMQGPMETSGMSLVNNQYTEYKALTYVLKPLKKGRLVVPGTTALVNGKKMTSNRVIVEVSAAGPATGNPYPTNPGRDDYQDSEEDFVLGENENAEEKIKANLLVKLDLDKTTVYVGQPIVATYKLYTRLRSESRVSKRPSLNGFSVYDMVEPSGQGPVIEKINGKAFMMHIIRKTQLIPLQDGKFVLDPVELENKIRFLRTNQHTAAPDAQSPLEKMFNNLMVEPAGEWEEHSVTLSSEAREITILPLPSPAPETFNGAVGQFSILGQLLDSAGTTGDNIRYAVKIEGSGNLPLVNAPSWQLPEGIEQYEPVTEEFIDKTVTPMKGLKSFTYSFSMGQAGMYNLPPVIFTYFDPAMKTYKNLSTQPASLKVAPAPEVKPFAAGNSNKTKDNSQGWPDWLWISVIGLGLIISGWILTLLRNKKKQQAAIPNPLPPEIPLIKPSALLIAKSAFDKKQSSAFYRAVELALWLVISEKLRLPEAAQQKNLALTRLAAIGLPPDRIAVLTNCWNICEWALYVPNPENPVDTELLENAEQLVKEIEALPNPHSLYL